MHWKCQDEIVLLKRLNGIFFHLQKNNFRALDVFFFQILEKIARDQTTNLDVPVALSFLPESLLTHFRMNARQ